MTQATLTSPDWAGFKSDFWGGQETHKVMAEAAQQVDVSFGWSPFTDFVYTTYAEELAAVKAGTITFEQAMQNLQDKATTYAEGSGLHRPVKRSGPGRGDLGPVPHRPSTRTAGGRHADWARLNRMSLQPTCRP